VAWRSRAGLLMMTLREAMQSHQLFHSTPVPELIPDTLLRLR
jgi:hypothetical protein